MITDFKRLLLPLFLIIISLSCESISQKEVRLDLNEVFVYYDDKIEEYKILRSGNHKYSTKYFSSKYSLEETEIKDRILVATKDEKKLIVGLTYWYAIKETGIVEVHRNYADRLEQHLILPNIRSVARSEFKGLFSDSLDVEIIRDLMLQRISKINNYSDLINSKSFIINELKFED